MDDFPIVVTHRKGIPVVAYLYFPGGRGKKSVRTEEAAPGLLVDYTDDGLPMGIEILSPGKVRLETLIKLLEDLHMRVPPREHLAPLIASA